MCKSVPRKFPWMIAAILILSFATNPAVYADDASLSESGNAKYNAGDYPGAKPLFEQLLADYPASDKRPNAALRLAEIKWKTNAAARSELIAEFEQVRATYTASQEGGVALVHAGYLRAKARTTEDTSGAIEDFKTFLSAYPDHPMRREAQLTLGRLYARNLDLAKAEESLDLTKESSQDVLGQRAGLHSGFMKIMRFYATRDKSQLTAAIGSLTTLIASDDIGIRARAELGIAEATLLSGRHQEAHTKYSAAADAYSGRPYFRGLALYGKAFSSYEGGRLTDAVNEFTGFLDAQAGSTLAEKDSSWRTVALGTVSPGIQAQIQEQNSWERLPGIDIVRKSAFYRSRCQYLLRRYDDAIDTLTALTQLLPAGSELHTRSTELLSRCRNANGGR